MGSERKRTKMSEINSRKEQQMCFLHLQQDSCSAPGPDWQDSIHKGRDEGCKGDQSWENDVGCRICDAGVGTGRVSPEGFNKEDQEIRERYPPIAGLGQSSQRLPRLLEEHYVSAKVWPDPQGLI